MMRKAGVQAGYEVDRIEFTTTTHYLPDWKLRKNFYIETKGYFSSSNRSRLLDFKRQHPEITVCLVFQNAQNKLYAKSKTTYAQWCDKHDFPWADIDDGLPIHWWETN